MKVYRIAALALSVGVSSGALAQAVETAPAATAASAATSENGQADIIVTAQKRAERLQDVPISITTQSAAQLQSAGVQTTKDLTKVVPGLVFA